MKEQTAVLWNVDHLVAFPLPLCPVSSHPQVSGRVKALGGGGGLQEKDVSVSVFWRLGSCTSLPASPLWGMALAQERIRLSTPSQGALPPTCRACDEEGRRAGLGRLLRLRLQQEEGRGGSSTVPASQAARRPGG